MNRYLKMFIVIGALTATSLMAQQPTKRINVTIDTKPTAKAQLDYARTLIAKVAAAKSWDERHLAVANAAGTLSAVERAWPQNRAAVAEANLLSAQLYLDAKMPRNAAEVAQQALAESPNDHRLHAIVAQASERLGDKGAAGAAYARLVEKFDARHGDGTANVGSLSAAAYFFAKEKQHDKAAAALRHASAVDGLAPTMRVTLLLRAIEQAAQTGDRNAIARDLADLREARRIALGTNLTPAQRELLNIAEAAIARFERNPNGKP